MMQKLLLLCTIVLTMVFNVSAEMFSQVSSTLNLGSVYYITKEANVDSLGVILDQQVMDDLEGSGYDLTVGYPAEGGVINVADLNDFDAVVVGRNVSSGDFKSADWADVESPIMVLSAYVARTSRFNLVSSDKVNREATVAVDDNKERITKAAIADADDYAFKGIASVDGKMDYMTWFYDYLGYGADTFATTNNGKLLASIVDADTAAAEGNVLMARWEAGTETYAGSGTTPKGYRTYLQMGADDKSDPKKIHYAQYTSASYSLLVNELNYLIRTGKNVQYMVKEGNMDADGVLLDQKVLDDLAHVGYTNITKTYPGEGGVINTVELSNADLVVVGRNVSSGDFKSTDWAEVEAPILVTSAYIARNSRFNLMSSDGVKREAVNAVADNKDRITKALVADVADSVFMGVPVSADAKMDYMTWFYDYIAYGADTFATTNNGKLLASIVDADTAAAEGNVLMARWEAGKETYAGSGTTPKGYRTYLQMGADDKSDPKNIHYAQYTDALFSLLINEMAYLTSKYAPAGIVLSDDATLASIEVSAGELSPAFADSILMYAVELAEGTTEVPTITATPTNANAVIEQINAEAVPGNTIIKVTSEDGQNSLTYIVSFKVIGGPIGDVVEPGMGTLDEAVMLAEDGDVLVLANGGQYDILSPLVIDKKLTIKAETIPELPGLENMPIISNMFTSTQVFDLNTNCDLTLIGIDVDGLGGSFIFNPMMASDQTINLYVNRCRLHNTVDDILNDDGSNENNITMGNLYIRNSFVYDNGSGHGIYTKHFASNGSVWKFENVTMWNLGQQFTWIRVMGDGTQEIVFDHMTGYNLSTSSDDKELFGNDEKTADDAAPECDLVIDFKNNILSTQVSANDGSLIFKNADGHHDITINNNVLFAVQPILNTDVLTLADNLEGTDPQFADPDNGDFTVGNADLFAAADDGKIVGAVYWHPDFVDDFSDIETGVNDLEANSNIKNIVVSPNPFTDAVKLAVELTEGSDITLSIFNVNGQLVATSFYNELGAGSHDLVCNTSDFQSGVYFYQVVTNTAISTGKIIKN